MTDLHRCPFCGHAAAAAAMTDAEMTFEALNLEIRELRTRIAELRGGAGAGRAVRAVPAAGATSRAS
ncbi:MAG: hypothetical protein M3070_16385 [Actinomycetota bacterium]|nr:hypothetical protein [Actinomycetota bacterium]